MTLNIRTSLYKSDLFCPRHSSGYSVNTFLHYSAELANYPIAALEAELQTMVSERLLRLDREIYYWATREGKLARQMKFAKEGLLSKPLVEQLAHPIPDLILALAASNSVDPFSAGDRIPFDALPIYLHQHEEGAVMEAVETLLNDDLLYEDIYPERKAVFITGRGLHKYRTECRHHLGLGDGEGILRLLEPRDTRFGAFGFDPSLHQNLEQRWIEVQSCADAGAYLAAVILLGSILEGALLAKLKANISAAMTASKAPKDKGGSGKPLDEWTLAEYISVSTELGYVPRSVEKHSHELRDTRNLVHPNKQVKQQLVVDESLYRISKEVADTVLSALAA